MNSTRILLFVHALESRNFSLCLLWKKISQEIIFMTRIVLENDVNHERFKISVKKKCPEYGIFKKYLYFQTVLSE